MTYVFCVILVAVATAVPPVTPTQGLHNAIQAATVYYVHKEHGPSFDPKISCIQLTADGKGAIVNYAAGPPDDPIETSLTLVRPAALTSTQKAFLSPQLAKVPPLEGWAPIAATTSASSTNAVLGNEPAVMQLSLPPRVRKCI